jgi:predicted membrane protein
MEKEKMDKRLLLGVAIVLIGLALLAKNFGFLSYDLNRYIFRWEMILIGLGLVFILTRSNRSTGIILVFIGGAFYASSVFDLHINIWQLLLPAVLILAGVLMIFRNKIDGDWSKTIVPNDEHHIDEVAVFGGGDRLITSQQFEGGKVTAVFGGLNYNMQKAKLAPGKNVIDVFCIFGGMKLVVPDDWTIKIRVMSLFGGFNDKRHSTVPESVPNNETQLIIKGIVLFGGGEIKSYFD